MLARRLAAGTIGAAAAVGLFVLLLATLAPGGWTPAKLGIGLCFLGVAPWLGICAANGAIGFAVLMLAADPPRAVLPVAGPIDGAVATRTALAVLVRDEDLPPILARLRRLLDELGERWFAGFVLSDSRNPMGEAEAACAAGIAYRHRARNTGFKAGNLMEFLDGHADAFPFAVVLDADSVLTAAAVRRLVGILQAAPTLGLVQHLTMGLPAETPFAALFQFGMRSGMRVWATGQAWWQGDSGPYWGHNAILRTGPFRDHARLPTLPSGRHILSHDQVEAALLRAAGWGVAVWAGEDGSFEQNPPALPEFVARDRRWLAGNLQYVRLLGVPGLRPMGRWQLVQAILLFAGAPLYAAMFLLAVVVALQGGVPRGPLFALAATWTAVLYGPKLLGYVQTLVQGAGTYGGRGRFAATALAEVAFTLLLDAPMTVLKCSALLRVALGGGAAWLPQNRVARRVTWGEAAGLLWGPTTLGVLAFALLARCSWAAVLWALPFAGGLLAAVPLAVLSARPVSPPRAASPRRKPQTPHSSAAGSNSRGGSAG